MPTSLDLYRVIGTAGKVGTPGAPILHFDLLVHSSTGKASGQATITQAIAPPGGEIVISNVTGQVRQLIFGGQITLIVALQGTYFQPGPPPTEFIILEHFTAHFSVDSKWDGRGSFDYGTHVVNDVPVQSTKSGGSHGHPTPLYMAPIHEATASGDLARMKDIAAQAEKHIALTSQIQAALPALKDAITKAGG